MVNEHIMIRVRTSFKTQDFVFTSQLMAIKFAFDASRREEVMNFSVNYIPQYETTTITNAVNDLQQMIDSEDRNF